MSSSSNVSFASAAQASFMVENVSAASDSRPNLRAWVRPEYFQRERCSHARGRRSRPEYRQSPDRQSLDCRLGKRAAAALPSPKDSTRDAINIGIDLAWRIFRLGAVPHCLVPGLPAPGVRTPGAASLRLARRNLLIQISQSIPKEDPSRRDDVTTTLSLRARQVISQPKALRLVPARTEALSWPPDQPLGLTRDTPFG